MHDESLIQLCVFIITIIFSFSFSFLFNRCRKSRSRAYVMYGKSTVLLRSANGEVRYFEERTVLCLPGLDLSTVYWAAHIAYKRMRRLR